MFPTAQRLSLPDVVQVQPMLVSPEIDERNGDPAHRIEKELLVRNALAADSHDSVPDVLPRLLLKEQHQMSERQIENGAENEDVCAGVQHRPPPPRSGMGLDEKSRKEKSDRDAP